MERYCCYKREFVEEVVSKNVVNYLIEEDREEVLYLGIFSKKLLARYNKITGEAFIEEGFIEYYKECIEEEE